MRNAQIASSARHNKKRVAEGLCSKCSKPLSKMNKWACEYHRGYEAGLILFRKRILDIEYRIKILESKMKEGQE